MVLLKFDLWVFNHRKTVFAFWAIIILVSIAGMMRLHNKGKIVDDLPKK